MAPYERNNYKLLKTYEHTIKMEHIEESCSFWKSPIFVIQRKYYKWYLLTEFKNDNPFLQSGAAS